MKERKIAVLTGSLRKESWHRKLAKAFMKEAPEHLKAEIIEIGDLALYNEDLDSNPPPQWTAFRDKIKGMDAVFFVTPEYNRSTTAALKNALDVGSRPYGYSVWDGKPACVASGSIGAISGFGANHHLRQSLVFLNMPTMQQPEIYISNIAEIFNENGELADERTRGFFRKVMSAYADWVEKILG